MQTAVCLCSLSRKEHVKGGCLGRRWDTQENTHEWQTTLRSEAAHLFFVVVLSQRGGTLWVPFYDPSDVLSRRCSRRTGCIATWVSMWLASLAGGPVRSRHCAVKMCCVLRYDASCDAMVPFACGGCPIRRGRSSLLSDVSSIEGKT